MTGADGAIVEVVEDDDMAYRAVTGIVDGLLGLRLDVYVGLSGLCLTQRKALRSDDTLTDDRVDREACARFGVRSMAAIPLLLEGSGPLGVLRVVSSQPHTFSDLDLETLGALAHFVALALRNATDWEALDRRVRSDPLTGVANRAAVLERLNVWMVEQSHDGAMTLHCVRVPRFDDRAETIGQAAADRLLKEVAAALNSGVRSDDLVGRIAGDEFVVLCRDIEVEDADRMGERLAGLVGGIVANARSRHGETAEGLLRRAEEAVEELRHVDRESEGSAADAGT
jgi:diguanylate cyclase (GGDEF)-like protein